MGRCVGYAAAVEAAHKAVLILPIGLPWPPSERRAVEAFVHAALDLVAASGGVAVRLGVEAKFVAKMEHEFPPEGRGAAFHAAVRAKWASPAVQAALRSRGMPQGASGATRLFHAEFDARRRADSEAHGLRACPRAATGNPQSSSSWSAPSARRRPTAAGRTRLRTGRSTGRAAGP